MRPKFVVVLLLLALLALGAGLLLKQHLGGGSSAPAKSVAVASPVPGTGVAAEATPPPELAPAPLPVAPAPILTAEQRQEAIDAEVDRLYELSMKEDMASLSNILSDLTNTNNEIREAAIESAKQFGSTNAIPALKAAAETTDDLQEKIDYLEAADFLSVPPADFTRSNAPKPPKTAEQIQIDQQKDQMRRERRERSMKSISSRNSQPPPANNPGSEPSVGPNQ
jgi:hypothetical protein